MHTFLSLIVHSPLCFPSFLPGIPVHQGNQARVVSVTFFTKDLHPTTRRADTALRRVSIYDFFSRKIDIRIIHATTNKVQNTHLP